MSIATGTFMLHVTVTFIQKLRLQCIYLDFIMSDITFLTAPHRISKVTGLIHTQTQEMGIRDGTEQVLGCLFRNILNFAVFITSHFMMR